MSDLQKSFAKAKLAKLPPEAPPILDHPDMNSASASASPMDALQETGHDDGDDSSSASSAGTAVPSPTKNLFARPNRGCVYPCYHDASIYICTAKALPYPILTLCSKRPANHTNRPSQSTSLSWTDFFTQELYLEQNDPSANIRISHHVYLIPPSESAPLFVMHHGAGSSGLSFAACAGEIRKILPKAGVLSLDCRDHGNTQVTRIDDNDNSSSSSSSVEMDLTLETLSRDLLFVINETRSRMGWGRDLPDIVLVGHSLGGAVITDVAKQGALGQKLLAYAVLDVVEGTCPCVSPIWQCIN